MSSDEINGSPFENGEGGEDGESGEDGERHVGGSSAPPSRDGDEVVTDEAADDASSLAQTLLHRPVVGWVDGAGGHTDRRYVYPRWLQLLATLFILYHGTILLVHNLPSKGLAKGLQKKLNRPPKLWPLSEAQFGLHANHYWRASGNTQSWAMFAPNPHRSNIFMKVMVKDKEGEVWDLKHDIYGKRTYPYLWYDRMGKINRRIIDQKGYRRHYAAWVCREWERTHEGKSADEVQFVKMWTRIPPPKAVFERARGNIFRMGYDPMDLELHQREEDTIRCKTTRLAQLSPELRERYGLPPAKSERHFKGLHMRTWWDQRESEAAREEREQRASRPRTPGGDR